MGSLKEEILQVIQDLPDGCTLEDIQYHLYVRQKVAAGMKDLEEGRTISHDEVKRQVEEWLRSPGATQQPTTSTK